MDHTTAQTGNAEIQYFTHGTGPTIIMLLGGSLPFRLASGQTAAGPLSDRCD
jgi:hypothetical protein